MPWRPEDKEKKREYDRNWYKKNKESRKESNRQYYLKNKEKRSKKLKEYRTLNKSKYIKLGADYRKINCELTETEMNEIISHECFYCGDKTDIGIDRIDNSKGYIKENCVPCCGMCNRMKNVFSQESFIEKCIKISNKWKDKSL